MLKQYILSVEDNTIDIELMNRVVEKSEISCEIRYIRDGESAIQFFESSEFEMNPPKCIFIDIKLPKMNGLEVLDFLRNKKKIVRVPVIVLSSSDRPEEIDEAYNLGCNSFIEKQKDYENLKERLPQIINYWLHQNKN